MATNLRLEPLLAQALRDEAVRSGRSQQDIIRIALSKELGLFRANNGVPETADVLARRGVLPPRTSFREATHLVRSPPGVTVDDLLGREDRL